jgi:hypothetical protein
MTLLDAVSKLFATEQANSLFGVLPIYANATVASGLLAGIAFYAFILTLAISALCGIITAISGRSGALKTAICSFAFGAGAYALSVFAIPSAMGWEAPMDMITLALMAIGAVLFLAGAFKSVGKKAWGRLLVLIISAVVYALLVLGFKDGAEAISAKCAGMGLPEATLILAIFLLAAIGMIYDAIRVFSKKGYFKADLVRYIIGIIFTLAVTVFAIMTKATMFIVFSIIAVVLAIVLLLIAIKQKRNYLKSLADEYVAKANIPEIEEELEHEFVVEEYAEAMPYDGGPVEGVEIAEEVNPTFEDTVIPTQVNTAGYDFYNCKSFDPFIAILNNEERNQFTELFILKFKGVMPEIPDYQVGGDNREFFRKIFIYLGQYRDRIPDNLLAKIYKFAIKY